MRSHRNCRSVACDCVAEQSVVAPPAQLVPRAAVSGHGLPRISVANYWPVRRLDSCCSCCVKSPRLRARGMACFVDRPSKAGAMVSVLLQSEDAGAGHPGWLMQLLYS